MATSIKLCEKAIKEAHGIISVAAENLHIARETLHRRIQRSTKLQTAVHTAREKNIDIAEGKLLKQMNADYFPAIKYFLSTQGKTRGYTIKEEEKEEKETTIQIINNIVKTPIDETNKNDN